jgi:hypothetical protein
MGLNPEVGLPEMLASVGAGTCDLDVQATSVRIRTSGIPKAIGGRRAQKRLRRRGIFQGADDDAAGDDAAGIKKTLSEGMASEAPGAYCNLKGGVNPRLL